MAVQPEGDEVKLSRRPTAQTAAARPGEHDVHPAVLRMRTVGRDRAVQDAELLVATSDVVVAVREAVLERRGLVGAELGRTQEAAVGQEVRNLATAELQVAIGLGLTEARALVTLAGWPPELRSLVDGALRSGEASWSLVRPFVERSVGLTAEQRMLVALALFGDDDTLAHGDRLDPDGGLSRLPWGHSRFGAALDAEVTACRSTDPDEERHRRARAYERRRSTLKVHDDGTATLRVTGPATTMVAVGQRLDRAARVLRRAGDDRTLDQLRCDVANAVVLYGTITLPVVAPATEARETAPDTTGTDPTFSSRCSDDGLVDDTIAPDDLAHVARVVNALPLVQLQVVVPYNTLAGGFPMCGRCGEPTADTSPRPSVPPDTRRPPGPPVPRAHRRASRGPVAEVLGPHPFFVTDGHARELALLPGTTLHRLVVDPRDGRLMERTVRSYRPDVDMRRQVIAADVYSRAPGSRLGAHAGELDHVRPYGWAGGPTAETNLALLAKRPHQFKTDGAWHAAINARRDLTVTSVLGQVTTTRVHDYRTYLRTRYPEDVTARRDAANRLVYAALAEQRARADDGITLTWTSSSGAVHDGPSPGHPRIQDLLEDGVARDDE